MLTLNIQEDIDHYLEQSEYIDHQHPAIKSLASQLMAQSLQDERPTDVAVAHLSFNYVRDQIKHTADFKIDKITCKASDVLQLQTGYCYAKSHLLAALLRANKIPAGLCYQRLSIELDEQYCSTSQLPFCSHGLNAVYLNDYGWYRIDPRGNKVGVNATFNPPHENLAFPIDDTGSNNGQIDFSEVHTKPLDEIINLLTNFNTYREVNLNLPDSRQQL